VKKILYLLIAIGIFAAGSRSASAQPAPDDPVLGNWRGTLKSAGTPQGSESPFVLSIVRKGDGYGGSMSGLSGTSELPLARVVVTGTRVRVESVADSKIGQVSLSGELTAERNTMKGAGTLAVGAQRFDVAFDLTRRARTDVIQPTVEQRIDYFTGRWTFEYLGGEFPPLSQGGRSGTVTFTRLGASSFASGRVEGDVEGKKFQETISVGFDPATSTVVYTERRQDGVELVSLGNWQSPLAITFLTAPVQSGGRTYQLRRTMSVLSDSAFNVTEEFSVDGGPFRRLGNARYTKAQ
jgi:hypothetical protein